MYPGVPEKQGLYDPQFEHDSCGVGFIADMNGGKTHAIVRKALQVLINLEHRGAKGCEVNTGDGAGITMQVPDKFLRAEAKKLGIKTFAMVDTNADPNLVDFPIPANDDSSRSISFITNYITNAIKEGLAERGKEKEEHAEEAAKA